MSESEFQKQQRALEELSQPQMKETDFANAATLLRLGTFRKFARRLYTFFQPQVLEWPSLSVCWLPNRKRVEGLRDFSLQTVVVGTQAASLSSSSASSSSESAIPSTGTLNYLACVEVACPLAVEDVDVMVRDEESFSDEHLGEVPYRRVRGHTRLSQLVGIAEGPILKIRHAFGGGNGNTAAAAAATGSGEGKDGDGLAGGDSTSSVAIRVGCQSNKKVGGDVQIFHLDATMQALQREAAERKEEEELLEKGQQQQSTGGGGGGGGGEDRFFKKSRRGTRPSFTTDPIRNLPDVILESTSSSSSGFGLAVSEAQVGRFVSGNDSGNVLVWDVESKLVFGEDDFDSAATHVSSSSKLKSTTNKNVLRRNPRSENNKVTFETSTGITRVKPLTQFMCHTNAVTDVSCHGTQPHLLLSASLSGRVALHDMRVAQTDPEKAASGLETLRHDGGCFTAEFHPTASFQVATGGGDGAVRLWDLRNWKAEPVACYLYHTKTVQRVSWAPFSDCVFASAGNDGLVCLWDLARGVEVMEKQQEQEEEERERASQRATSTTATTRNSSSSATSASGMGEIRSEASKVPRELTFVHAGHTSPVVDFAWNPSLGDEWTIASVEHANTLQCWRPNATSVTSQLQVDAFDSDYLDDS